MIQLCKNFFLQFAPLPNVSANGLTNTSLKTLHSFGINLKKLPGQGYDGAPAVSGAVNGVQIKILEKYPSAMYVHCSIHSLNLATSSICSVSEIKHCMNFIGEVYHFFNVPEKQLALIASIKKISPESKKHKLVNLCSTTWVERKNSVSTFIELENCMIDALYEISD